MQKSLGILIIVALVVVTLLGSVAPAKAAECCARPSAVYCYACAGVQSVLQQQNVDPSLVEARNIRLQQTALVELGIVLNVEGYGAYWVRDAKTLAIVPDGAVSPLLRLQISELVATGR